MSSPFIIPFNFQPISTTIRNSSYTIPSGNYALVKTNSAFFSIGGTNIYRIVNFSLSSSATNTTTFKSIPLSGLIHVWSASIEVTAGISSSNSTGFYGVGNSTEHLTTIQSAFRTGVGSTEIPSSDVPSSALTYGLTNGSLSVTATVQIAAFYASPGSQTEFWLPSGTQLNGANYTVALFSNIT